MQLKQVQEIKKILEALDQDLAKGEFEALSSEFMPVLNNIECALKHGKKWIKPKKFAPEFTTFDGYAAILQKPFGLTLIMALWNYPAQLSLLPLVGAIASGNCTMLKISELTHVKSLLELYLDKVFFTGLPQVRRIIMEKVVKHLTPVTFELVGRLPCVSGEMLVDDPKKAVKRYKPQ